MFEVLLPAAEAVALVAAEDVTECDTVAARLEVAEEGGRGGEDEDESDLLLPLRVEDAAAAMVSIALGVQVARLCEP